jgi:hypothetical protein
MTCTLSIVACSHQSRSWNNTSYGSSSCRRIFRPFSETLYLIIVLLSPQFFKRGYHIFFDSVINYSTTFVLLARTCSKRRCAVQASIYYMLNGIWFFFKKHIPQTGSVAICLIFRLFLMQARGFIIVKSPEPNESLIYFVRYGV